MVGRRAVVALLLMTLLPACSGDDEPDRDRPGQPDDQEDPGGPEATSTPVEPLGRGSFDTLIPRPLRLTAADGDFLLDDATAIVIDEGAEGEGASWAGDLLRGYVNAATGFDLEVATPDDGEEAGAAVTFTTVGSDSLGDEGYELRIARDRIEVVAQGAAGFGWAVQTIRQLLPPEAAPGTVLAAPWAFPTGTVRDIPRFAWRGAMLDVARHFFPPGDVERVIDLMAMYKLNRLHLHLTDDQGWRLQMRGYPALTDVGAATQVGGGPGGFYSQDEFRGLVDYASLRGIMVIPEIDMPGHTTAALASVPGLNCGAGPAGPSTRWSDGSSSLCIQAEQTFQFVQDVVNEVAALTLGPYIHLGGDEAEATSAEDYQQFISRATEIIHAAGKQPVGWDEIGTAPLAPSAVVQHWNSTDNLLAGVAQGAGIVMSPASQAYMDMKYDDSTPIGLRWAGTTDTRDAYEWDPATIVAGVPANQLLGLEAPLWTETVTSLAEIEQMMLPRLPGYAELGWSPLEGRSWDEYRVRLASHAARWTASGRSFTADPPVPWPQ